MAGTSVAVTGASGFVGRHLVLQLGKSGSDVRRIELPHEPSPTSDLEARLHGELSGCRAVVHLAARVHHAEDPPEEPGPYQWPNIELTRIVLRATAAAGARTLVFASSVKAVGEQSTEPWTEATPPQPMDAYGRSKLAAEAIVAEEGKALGLHTVTLRFPVIYGPGMRANMLRLFQAVERGLPLALGALHQRRSLLFVGNAVAAIEAALNYASREPGLFYVRDGDDVSPSQLVTAIAASLGRPARLVPVPPGLLRVAGWLGDRLSGVIRSPIDSRAIARLTESLQVDDTLIRERLGYRPRFSMEEGLAQTAAWFRALAPTPTARR